ncbi:Steroidogenic acute regulatory protein, mitochondrial [Araneus ventricosus]|uniref:Steroidogenic acute regulatory protein, mitochondrial n=1 Tax=Araneus ventricosus TaxID=182803 RepID=A0A4Y2F5G2_ARAVE|nr:Steroidogenic acute regulatory protein, mitochondrial [Araneus ventricosus]
MFYDCVSFLISDNTLHRWMMELAVHQKPLKKSNFHEVAERAMNESMRILESKDWSFEMKSGDDIITSTKLPTIGKVFKYEGVIDMPPEKINNKLFYNVEETPEWSQSVEKANVVETIDNNTNVVHFVSASRCFVSSRDFVHLRAWKKKDDAIIHSSFSITHPKAPPNSTYIRAEHRFNTFILRPYKGDPSKTHLLWLMQVSLKGWLSQNITDQVVTYGMADQMKDIRST